MDQVVVALMAATIAALILDAIGRPPGGTGLA